VASSGKIVHIELPAQDADRATRFHSALFGWQFQDSGFEGIDYRMFQGEPPGAVFPSENAGEGPMVYFDTDDIDAELAKVRELGGEAAEKQPIPGIGWYAGVKDTEGNSFSFFQSDESVQPQ
jgi:uncharacterized protein